MSKERTTRRQATPYTRSRVGSTPIKVHNLAQKEFSKKPSDLEGQRDRERAMASVVVGDAAPEFDPDRSVQEQEKAAAAVSESRVIPIPDAEALIGAPKSTELLRRLKRGEVPDPVQAGGDIAEDVVGRVLAGKRGQSIQRAKVPFDKVKDLLFRYMGHSDQAALAARNSKRTGGV